MNIVRWLERAARYHPDAAALARGMSVHHTYRSLLRRVSFMASGLRHRHRLEPGDRVAVAMTNCVEAIETFYAIWHAGLVAVPMNAKLHPREFAYILDNSGAALCLCTDDLAEDIESVRADCPALCAVVVAGGKDYQRLGVGDPIGLQDRGPSDPAWLFYTSGTTGRPKGATLSHRNLIAMTQGYLTDVDDPGLGAPILHAAPVSHGSGLYNFPILLRAGVQVIPESGRYEPDETVALANHWRGLSVFLAPTMVKRLVEHPSAAQLKAGAIRTIVYGGGPMYVADIKDGMAKLGDVFAQIYGQGESPMTITALTRAEHMNRSHPRWEQRLASVGRPQSGVEVRITDAEGVDLPEGEIGEIVVRGDVVMAGYWNDPAATAKALRENWLFTGDMGSVDADGFLTLKDRSKDMIISGGTNIYPREIEEVLLRHPAVLEVSVVGRPHPEWGEEVVAFVVPHRGGSVGPAELDRLCLDSIARFKRPKDYRFVESLPKNNYGKVLKTELRKLV
ncbi:MAG: AMP-binding protein [Reyranellaceae bacterium]